MKKIPDKYIFNNTEASETGLRLFSLKDKETGVKVNLSEFNENFDVHATVAWAGARTSRSSDAYEDIFKEIFEAFKDEKYTAGEKLAKVFVGYGHASVADMSPVMLYMNNIPIHQAFWILNHTSVGAGQELSTRYVEVGDFGVPDIQEILGIKDKTLSKKWQKSLDFMSAKYKKWNETIETRLKAFLSEGGRKVPTGTLTARTLDIARFWIPSGSKVSMTLITSTRNWIDLIVQLRECNDPSYQALGEQLFTMLNLSSFEESKHIKADLSGLTKYSEGKFTIGDNLQQIKDYLKKAGIKIENKVLSKPSKVTHLNRAEKDDALLMLMQYISVLYPNADELEIIDELNKLDPEQKSELGELILKGHNHHNLMRNAGDIRGMLFSIETAVAYVRDLNRHRATGRLVHMFETDDYKEILKNGYHQNYQLDETDCLKDLKKEWNADFNELYQMLDEILNTIYESYGAEKGYAIYNLLPLGHQIKYHLSAPITQLNYLNSLRISLGGDYGYRHVVYQLLEELRSNPFMKSMLSNLEEPDPNDKEQILGRS